MDFVDIVLRLIVAAAVGALVGLNRDLHGKPTGVPTLGLVGLGSALAVLTVAAGLTAAGQRLGILHIVGMLLIVAVGSNYALFFDRLAQERHREMSRTLASLAVANLATVIGFGVLAFSSVPVLAALGATTAPGALLALVFSALLAPRAAFDS